MAMKQISLRLPDDLHRRLAASAAEQHRSLHGQILWELGRDGRTPDDTKRPEPSDS